MSLSIETQIADYMLEQLSQHGFTDSLEIIAETNRAKLVPVMQGTVVRTYLPEYDLEDCDRPRVSIIPFNHEQRRFTRKHMEMRFFIDTVVNQRLINPRLPRGATADQKQANWRTSVTSMGDRIMRLSQEIAMFFECSGRGGADYSNDPCDPCACAAWINCTRDAAWQRADVEDKHVIFCVIRHYWLTYRDICCCTGLTTYG